MWKIGVVGLCVLAAASSLGCGEAAKPGTAPDGTSGSAGSSIDATSGAAGRSTNNGGAHSGGGEQSAGGQDSSQAGDPAVGCDCDDGIACTADACVKGECQHQALHFTCEAGTYCSLTEGCAQGEACAKNDDCKRADNCLTATCNTAKARCVYAFLDSDHDGQAPESCGGNDCNDADRDINGAAPEVCDGKDNDCDGQTDPLEGSGCTGGLVCHSATCDCAVDLLLCSAPSGKVCVDTTSDQLNCGGCYNACADTETCQGGVCECNDGNKICAGKCADLKEDLFNCGKCGRQCGNAECNSGACECPSGTTDCSATNVPACVNEAEDENNCGACGNVCLSSGQCQSGACDASVSWVKIFKSDSATSFVGQTTRIDTDAAGNLYLAYGSEPSTYTMYPNGVTALWTGAGMIAKLDSLGTLKWAMPSDVPVHGVAAVADAVWATAYVYKKNATIAGHFFALRANHTAFTAVVKLDPTTGALLDQFQIDHVGDFLGYTTPLLVHDDTKAWLAFSQRDAKLGDTDWPAPSTNHITFIYAMGGNPLWVPGTLTTFERDANGKLIIQTWLPENTTVNFGGQDFATGSFGSDGFARYTPALVHDVSFINLRGGVIGGTSKITVGVTDNAWLFTSYTDAGVANAPLLAKGPPWVTGMMKSYAGQFFAIGNSNYGDYQGRHFSGLAAFMKFGGNPFGLQASLELNPNYNVDGFESGYGNLQDYVVVDDGASAVIAIQVQDGLNVGRTNYDVGDDRKALALLKVKLN